MYTRRRLMDKKESSGFIEVSDLNLDKFYQPAIPDMEKILNPTQISIRESNTNFSALRDEDDQEEEKKPKKRGRKSKEERKQALNSAKGKYNFEEFLEAGGPINKGPRRPLSPYIFFSQEKRKELKALHPSWTSTQIMKQVSTLW